MVDVIVIGAGVVGASIARELSRYDIKVCVLEKESDVASGTSKANSGIVHAGYDAEPGSLMAKMNVQGNAMFEKLSGELEFHFKKTGSLVVAFSEDEIAALHSLKEKGEQNGVPGLEILDGETLRKLEPNLNEAAVAALYAPTGGITCAYEMTWALAENAVVNGAALYTDCEVKAIRQLEDGSFCLQTPEGEFHSRFVVNAAGVFADEISKMAGAEEYEISPRKGEYCLLDRNRSGLVNRVIFQTPGPLGKGILVTPTVDGNILVGPNAYGIKDRFNLETTRAGIEEVLKTAAKSIPELPIRDVITSFSGLRAVSGHDFIIEPSQKVRNFIHAAGICSPGLTSAPAIGVYAVELLKECGLQLEEKEGFNPFRKAIPRFREMDNGQRVEMIRQNPLYGRIICRCEMVTEGEVVDAIHRPVGAKNLDGVKRRVRTGMGRCQGGFCSPRVTEILSRETGIPMTDITKFGGSSYILYGKTRDTV